MTEILFAKVKDGAVFPTKREEDAGFDIYPCFEDDYMVIRPHQTVLIPTGIISAFDPGYVMVLKERGSTGKLGIGQRSGVFDSGYRGEWLVPITNHGLMPLVIWKNKEVVKQLEHLDGFLYCLYPYNKAICQALLLEVPRADSREATPEEVLAVPSERGDGKFGSSGK